MKFFFPDSQDFVDPSFDMETEESREIELHGKRLVNLALDPTGRILVTGDMDGVVRAGLLAGGEPHLLYGHAGPIEAVGQLLDALDGLLEIGFELPAGAYATAALRELRTASLFLSFPSTRPPGGGSTPDEPARSVKVPSPLFISNGQCQYCQG